MHTIDTLRTYAPHETGYWAAQRHAFHVIKKVEDALKVRDSWAGKYIFRIDHELEEMVVEDDCSADFEEAHIRAADLAADACLGNAYSIIIGQCRNDETARLIRDAYDLEKDRRDAGAQPKYDETIVDDPNWF